MIFRFSLESGARPVRMSRYQTRRLPTCLNPHSQNTGVLAIGRLDLAFHHELPAKARCAGFDHGLRSTMLTQGICHDLPVFGFESAISKKLSLRPSVLVGKIEQVVLHFGLFDPQVAWPREFLRPSHQSASSMSAGSAVNNLGLSRPRMNSTS